MSELQGLVRDKGVPFERALIDAGSNRLRPIAMTTIAERTPASIARVHATGLVVLEYQRPVVCGPFPTCLR